MQGQDALPVIDTLRTAENLTGSSGVADSGDNPLLNNFAHKLGDGGNDCEQGLSQGATGIQIFLSLRKSKLLFVSGTAVQTEAGCLRATSCIRSPIESSSRLWPKSRSIAISQLRWHGFGRRGCPSCAKTLPKVRPLERGERRPKCLMPCL